MDKVNIVRQALTHLRRRGESILPADVARLSPLGSEHINLLGRYSFDLPQAVRNGKLRPLRRQATEAAPQVEAADGGSRGTEGR